MAHLVNGKVVEFSAEDEAAFEADRAALVAPPVPRDFLAEIDALTTKLARYEKTEAALISKGVLSADDVKVSLNDAEMGADALIVKVR